jgi:predicted  nucleic acid-binding Zn-ribbon protein
MNINMDSLKDFFTPIYDRVKSPLYGSFVVSWCIINWKFFYVLFSNRVNYWGAEKSYYLKAYLSCSQTEFTILIPLLVALAYIFLLPWADFKIFGFIEREKQKKLEKKYEITKLNTVAGDKYIDLLLNFKKLKGDLSIIQTEVAEKEGDIIEKEENIKRIEEENLDLKIKLEKLLPDKLEDIFNGNWFCFYKLQNSQDSFDIEKFIIDGKNYKIYGKESNTTELVYLIDNIVFKLDEAKLTFIKWQVNSRENKFESIKLVKLNLITPNIFEGFEISYEMNGIVKEYSVRYIYENEYIKQDKLRSLTSENKTSSKGNETKTNKNIDNLIDELLGKNSNQTIESNSSNELKNSIDSNKLNIDGFYEIQPNEIIEEVKSALPFNRVETSKKFIGLKVKWNLEFGTMTIYDETKIIVSLRNITKSNYFYESITFEANPKIFPILKLAKEGDKFEIEAEIIKCEIPYGIGVKLLSIKLI